MKISRSFHPVCAGVLLRTCKDLWRDCILLSCALALSATPASSSSPSFTPAAAVQHSGVKRHIADTAAEGVAAVNDGGETGADSAPPAFEDTELT